VWTRAAMLALLLCAPSCSNDWRTDMWYQQSVRPEDAPRPQPEHSIPLGSPAPIADRDEADDLKNPVKADEASVQRGRALFAERCACCHGPSGHGGGPVSKLFPPAPDLAYQTVVARSDGFIYGTITLGGRAMPSQREGLSLKDRWDLVNTVRSIQKERPPEVKP